VRYPDDVAKLPVAILVGYRRLAIETATASREYSPGTFWTIHRWGYAAKWRAYGDDPQAVHPMKSESGNRLPPALSHNQS